MPKQTSINSFFRSSIKNPGENLRSSPVLNGASSSLKRPIDTDNAYSSKKLKSDAPIISKSISEAPISSKSKLNAFQFRKSNKGEHYAVRTAEEVEVHAQFLDKLGKPGSLARLKLRNRRNRSDDRDQDENQNENENEDQDQDENDDTDPKPKKPSRRQKLTPLDEQYIALKKEYPDAIILVEVGYRYKLYGFDAAVAAKEIGWVLSPGKLSIDNSHPDDHLYTSFATCSFPVQNLDRHVQTLVKRGHKVGVVNQMETAAIKSTGDTRNKIFKRELTSLSTQGTIFEDFQYESQGQFESLSMSSGYILSLCIDNSSSQLKFAILAVRPSTGDIIVDEFSDTPLLTEFETRLLHIQPCEIVLVGDIPTNVTNMIQNLSNRGSSSNLDRLKIRIEHQDQPDEAEASSSINSFYSLDENIIPPTDLTPLTSICLYSIIEYLKKFKLENILYLTKNFSSFQNRNHMLLNGNTLTSLEIFQNETTYTQHGSLFWVMDQTHTAFGQRLLKSWIANPLIDREQLEYRAQAVSELVNSRAKMSDLAKLTEIMSKLPDLEKGLARIYYKRCTRKQLYYTLEFLNRISTAFTETDPEKVGFKSKILNNLFSTLPKCSQLIAETLVHINPSAAKSDDKEEFFKYEEFDEYDNICGEKLVSPPPPVLPPAAGLCPDPLLASLVF